MQELLALPTDMLSRCVSMLLPSQGFGATASEWRSAIALGEAAGDLHAALGESLQAAFEGLGLLVPAKMCGRRCWMRLIRALHSADEVSWRPVRTLRAVRPQYWGQRTPVHSAPRLSGATLSALPDGQLVLFGGRDSNSGDTVDSTFLITVSWSPPSTATAAPRGVAQWDVVTFEDGRQPQPRCYHSAALWGGSGPSQPSMLVFGGAGEGSALHDDVWVLGACPRATGRAGNAGNAGNALERGPESRYEWVKLELGEHRPAGRSSHLCCSWDVRGSRLSCLAGCDEQAGRSAIVHGGLGQNGVCSDVWLLPPPSRSR